MKRTAPQFPEISGYTITEQLYLGSRTSVYRAVHINQQLPVVIKLLQREYPTFGELVQFRNQYAIAKNLPIAGIVQPLSLETFGNGYALVMADWGGISLDKYIQQHQLDLTEKLAIVLQITEILHDLHKHRVIHKDIKPANILIHPESQQIKLIDFSIASLLPKETQEIQNPNTLEGTLAYLAPEQTGRMNRGIDYRSDFYALGITLYQLFTSRLPFVTDDPLELVHCHIAKIATPANDLNTDVPKMLGAIVAKLMAKNAEDRYQSAVGLKHDLQECLKQWKQNSSITEFELGQRDLCDRFLIPEKLYGREEEVQTLLDAFDRVADGSSELMLVAGFSGIGKTAVVNEVHKPIVKQRGYFIKGKFDQFNRDIPFSAFVQAFRDLMGQLLSESDTQLQSWKTQILEALGENAQVIIELIPELERIIGNQPPAAELSGTAAQNRFNLLFQRFIQVFTTPEHPLVMFLDDLQWADSASLNLIQVLMSEVKTGCLLLLGAYRDNEVFPAHPLMLTLNGMEKAGAIIHTITLQPLSFSSLNHLIADTLHAGSGVVKPLTEIVIQKTQGNPFFATQFLKALYQEQLITFDRDAGHWQCDIVQVQDAALTSDVVEFMALQLQKLPEATQEILKLAACIGAQFNLEILAIVSQKSQTEVATALWKALQEGLILPQSDLYKFYMGEAQATEDQPNETLNYRFLHDRVQQAAYSLIPEAQKKQTHLTIGRLLRQNQSALEHLFEILNHFNASVDLIIDPSERRSLVQLNLAGCQRAKASTAYSAAVRYANEAINLLPSDTWQIDYQLTLQLYETAATAAYLNTEFVSAEHLVQTILQQSQQPIHCITAYELLVQIYIAQDQQLQAIETGLVALTKLGVPLVECKNWQENLPQLPNLEDLNPGSDMSDPAYLAALQILITITPPTHHVKPELFPAVVLTMVDLCDRGGYSELAAYAYGIYGLLLCAVIGDLDTAHRSGQVSLMLLENYQSRQLRTKVNMLFAVFLCACKEAGQVTLPLLKQGIEVGRDVGDIEYVSYCIMAYFTHLLLVGQPLALIEQARQNYIPLLEQFKQEHCIEYAKIWLRSADKLTDSEQLSLTATTEAETLARFESTHNHQCLFAFHLAQLITCYIDGKHVIAVKHAVEAINNQDAAFGVLLTSAHTFYHSLALLALISSKQSVDDEAVLETITANQKKLQHLAEHAPSNYLHKFELIAAEIDRTRGQKTTAIDLYDRAIAGAKTNGYLQEEAIANELAAKFYLDWGKEKVAAGYMQEAYYCYSRWGAKAKTDYLEQRYPNLLRPILQPAEASVGTWNTLLTISPLTASIHSSTHKSSSNTTINQALDFATILKASQALSRTIELDQLLHQLTRIILQNSGGDRCALILPDENGEWQIRAIATPDDTQLYTQPLANNPNLPVKLIQYVKNTQKTVVINELKSDLPVIDDYLMKHQPKSVLCLPLLNQGHLIGILYLKNQFTIGAFASDRIEVLNFLCTQAAISLENARLYQKAQEYAQQLEKSQLQVLQSEKMASLGNLVAGVAHEINNPVGFLNGSINNGKDYVQDLLEYLETYHQQQPPTDEVEELAQDIDLEYLLEDLPKLLDAMKGATNRIKNISTSLRTFSRADNDHKVSANLHEGLDSTLLILKYRLKASEHRPAIQVTKDYGDLPTIECFPGQLNQVFMNILANAIDVFDEMAQTKSYQDIEANPQQITIRTNIESNQVYIRIRDNGKGMSEDVQAKIFDHLFTTKDVGKGTGLGLAIARQIVVEKHSGSLNVWSEAGQGTEFCICLPISSK